MNHLYAPWREEYVTSEKIDGCVFCYILNQKDDEKYHILHRDKDYFIVMNKYPYSPGHFMLIPNKHTSNIEDLDIDSWQNMSKVIPKCVKLLKDTLNAQGVNVGINLGSSAGAGIAEHLHIHFVPRWSGDTNFITTISNTRVFSSDFNKIYQKLKNNIKI